MECFSGLLVDYLKEKEACIIIRGMRSLTDFEYESHMSMINKKLLPEVNTIFVMADSNYICVSSSGVKEAAMLGRGCQQHGPVRWLRRKAENANWKQ